MAKQSLIHTEMKLKQAKQACYQYKPFILAYKTTRRGDDPLLFETLKHHPHQDFSGEKAKTRWSRSSQKRYKNKAKQGLRGGKQPQTQK